MRKLDIGTRVPQIKKSPFKQLLTALAIATLSQVSIVQADNLRDPQMHDKVITYQPSRIIPNQYIVVFKDDLVSQRAETLTSNNNYSMVEAKKRIITDMSIDLATKASGSLERTYTSALSGFVLKTTSKKAVEMMTKDDRVAFIEPDQTVSIQATQNNATWGLDRIDQANLPLNNTYVYLSLIHI